MRTIWLAAGALLLVFTSLAPGKPPRQGQPAGSTWAISRTSAVEVAAPAPAPAAPCAAAGGCGSCGKGCGGWLDKALGWLTYRARARCGKGCACCSTPRLYQYFLHDCRECGPLHPPAQPCGKPGWWSSFCATGHRMFAMPTGHGCGGIR